MIRNVKANFIILNIVLLVCSLGIPVLKTQAMPSRITLQDNEKTTCKIIVLKSSGDVQYNVYARTFGNYNKFEADADGVITVEFTSSTYSQNVNLYLKGESEEYKKSVQLDSEKTEITVYFDSPKDILEYKRTARLFPIEGMVTDTGGNPIEKATVSIQGTGRRVFTDEMGLFKIDGDFNHTVVIRANGMNNLAFPITHFLQGEDNFNVTMQPKNGWKIYSSAEKMPEFPGGMTAFQHYLKKNLEYPEKAKKAKLEGVVVVQFIVDTDGSITNPSIARHLETSLDSAAWRLIKNMPKWSPASDYGTRIRCKYSLPVAFKIPKPKPVVPVDSLRLDSLVQDSLAMDSARMKKALADSLRADSLHKDSLAMNQKLMAKDSLQQDSTRMMVDKNQPTVKKRNIFVRFFRWLFGIERRQRKRAEKALLLKAQTDSILADSIALNGVPNDSTFKVTKETFKKALNAIPTNQVQVSKDSAKLQVDSLNINLKQLKEKAEELIQKQEKKDDKDEKKDIKKEVLKKE